MNSLPNTLKTCSLKLRRQASSSITQLINLMLAGSFPPDVNKIIFGCHLIAFEKKHGGVRPISIGYLIRNWLQSVHTVTSFKEEAKASNQSSGFSVPGGAEAAVHATRRFLSQMPSDHVIVKLDFINAFNSVRRDVVLDAAAQNTPELYPLRSCSLLL